MLFDFKLPGSSAAALHLAPPPGDGDLLLLAETARRFRGMTLAITPDTRTALRVEEGLAYLASDLECLSLPDWETLPYDVFSPHQDIVSQRLRTLYRLPRQQRGILIVPAPTLMQRLAPRSYLDCHALVLQRGEELAPATFCEQLEQAGYRRVAEVFEHGEYARRGAVLDLFPMGDATPYRIEWLDDEIDSIRTFEVDTQRSSGQCDAIELLPAHEFPTDRDAIRRFRSRFRELFSGDPQQVALYRRVSAAEWPGGIEYYLPLFFEHTATLIDYLPQATLAVLWPGSLAAMRDFADQLHERFLLRREDAQQPPLAPERVCIEPVECETLLRRYPRLVLDTEAAQSLPGDIPPDLPLDEHDAAPLQGFLDQFEGRVLLLAESPGRRELLQELLRHHGLKPPLFEHWHAFTTAEVSLGLSAAPLQHGVLLPGLALITESQLLGRKVRQQRRRSRRDAASVIRDLSDLSLGDPVVHAEHGVGRYAGLEHLDVDGIATEFVVLQYAEEGRLYVPVAALQLISRYTGGGESAPLHRLGSNQWEKARTRAIRRVRDVAAELLQVYAARAARPGQSLAIAERDYAQFAQAFPFEETPDQAAAIEAVLADMAAERPMDRVVCGDVGFGKTEVAMRAAFVAVHNSKQVAVLVPTTLLARQHYRNFTDRFADWPVRIESLSRLRSKAQQDKVLADLASGEVDIVIGTHQLLNRQVRQANLGLVIIDEEHRFGVRQKERLKALRSEVDILTLTATPIPRTLNMALSGLRDLSIIATPPRSRLAIKTFVSEWSDSLIQEACQRELARGGQVYFVHNEVRTIEAMAERLAQLLPGIEIGVAHGQMPEAGLEQVMLDFYHRRCRLLLCTTIVESGIDVPNANTIVIHRADRLGLAQLHQLRGRVGRSHHRAYAYLFVPPKGAMTPDAVKRIDAISALEDLGAGFLLANHDLEIRGAGELLGDEQSGQMHEVGFGLYCELLERAVRSLQAGEEPDLEQAMVHNIEIELHGAALIPDDYLPDVHTRLIMYKRIASASNDEALRELRVEMIDRFGLLPEPVQQLFQITALRLRAAALGVVRLDVSERGARIEFGGSVQLDPLRLVQLLQDEPAHWRMMGPEKVRYQSEARLDQFVARVQVAEEVMAQLGG